MASGRVDARPPNLKTLKSPQNRGGFPSPYPSHPLGPASQLPGWKYPPPLKTLKNRWFYHVFAHGRPKVPPKDPPRTPKDLSGSSQGRPEAPQGPSKQPPRLQNELQGSPKNLQMLKTQQKPMVFQCFYKLPNCFISATQASPGAKKSSPSTS